MLKELTTLFIFGVTGIVISVIFDIFRVIRKSFKTPNILTYIEDILFWILSGLLIIYVIFHYTTGEIRLYMILMIIIGAIIYFVTISKYFILINSKVINYLKSAILLVTKPFKKICNYAKQIFQKHQLKISKKFLKKDGK